MASGHITQRVVRRFKAAAQRRPVDPAKLQKLLLWIRKNPKLGKTIKELRPALDSFGWTIEDIRGGARFRSPTGETFDATTFYWILDREYPFLIKNAEGLTLEKWLTQNHFQDQVLEHLQMESTEVEKSRKEQERQDRARVGKATCSCCFGPFMLVPKAKHGDRSMPGVTLHGYKRPGVGYLQGQCFGSGWPPFELSKAGTEAYNVHLDGVLKGRKEALDHLESGKATTLVVGLKAYDLETTSPDRWSQVLASVIDQTRSDIAQIVRVQDMLTKRAASWEPQALA